MKYYRHIKRGGVIISCWLFVPGNNTRALEKVRSELNPNYIIIDLEDAIPSGEKLNTRIQVNDFLSNYNSTTPIYIRINDTKCEFFDDDLTVINFEKVAGIILPKCEHVEEISKVQQGIQKIPASLEIIPLIETVNGYYELENILVSSVVKRIAFGAVDLARDLSVNEEDIVDNPLIQHIRMQISLLSKKFKKLPPIDAPCIYLKEMDLLQKETVQARKLGYNGKQAIHPKQIECIQEVFKVHESEIVLAKEIVNFFETNNFKTLAYQDMMIDMPVYLKMKNLLASLEN
ncbi:HpcH/HpaI aldolase/citrate lyase family protein [Ureibacillus chungkukjangi]|uniref:Citrate lyase subunit beta/citryl-CoA lyase/(S)-citramalyl-CoA lyase n=1 Tax=Ureibacillus chungkukjangi TaxID=1202712 RepID=A0A318TMN9_9BACL|nr:CoA ester lyase [Ureibacillus chungkukjangi]MCM3389364.1 CoA ester lyase [Ureibacillus chungkukjangi]PYF05130.1 citrate lyase subunit beta/citryl-CoA lyase/(S)-citramalyl-CoA lyase [Ureibacillus chungkukjangi]HCG4536260.1 CoA ester lyase [Salmonella enterica subsp. enterica serovar Typhi str. AG3]